MLNKLLKYDLKSSLKFLSIFYALALFFSILTRIFLSIDNSTMMNIIGRVCSGAMIAMIFNILINNLMRLWIKFKNNLFDDESYLTHTLPVEKSMLYLSKFLTGIITMLISIIVIGFSLFVAYYSKENLELVKNFILPFAQIIDSSVIGIIVVVLFVFFLELFNGLQAGFTGLIIGHSKNSNKLGKSVLYGFIAYMITQIICVLFLGFGALLNESIMNLFTTNVIKDLSVFKTVVFIAIICYTFTIVLGYIVNNKLFNKGVNVE